MTEQFRQHYNYERPHQGRSCQNRPPCVACPTLPPLPPLPEQVDPDRWLDRLQGQAFARKVGADGCVTINHEPYYVQQALAGQQVVLFINAPERVFDLWHAGARFKQLPIKGLYGAELSLEEYVERMKEEARSEERWARQTSRWLQQLRLWA